MAATSKRFQGKSFIIHPGADWFLLAVLRLSTMLTLYKNFLLSLVCPRFDFRTGPQWKGQPRSQGLSSLPPLSLTTMEAEKRDPGNEVVERRGKGEVVEMVCKKADGPTCRSIIFPWSLGAVKMLYKEAHFFY